MSRITSASRLDLTSQGPRARGCLYPDRLLSLTHSPTASRECTATACAAEQCGVMGKRPCERHDIYDLRSARTMALSASHQNVQPARIEIPRVRIFTSSAVSLSMSDTPH